VETAAYYVALVTVVAIPPVVLSWLLVHPFAEHWRKIGPFRAYLILGSIVVIIMVAIYQSREPLLKIHFGVSAPLVILAALLLGFAIYLRVRLRQQFSIPRLLGLPEISSSKGPGELVTKGIYSQIRHPRYLEGGFIIASGALFSNYLAVYLLLGAYIPIIHLVVILEERELKSRFGVAYKQYCEEVPRFVPRLRRRGHCEGSE